MNPVPQKEEKTYTRTEAEAMFRFGVIAGAIAGSFIVLFAVLTLQTLR